MLLTYVDINLKLIIEWKHFYAELFLNQQVDYFSIITN